MSETDEQILGHLLIQHRLWLAVAESCTGGLVGHRITNIAGSSAYFKGGVIAYANAVKQAVLGVPGVLIEQHGAVSPEVALAMAAGVKRALQADIGLGITGIAGPDGGTPAKPVGLAYVAIAAPNLERVERCLAGGERESNKVYFADVAFQLALDYLGNSLTETLNLRP
ncbi:MAG: CinA family protein [Thermoflexales bacterium]|nr:CinA family protein [Thermoflexales bacterium]